MSSLLDEYVRTKPARRCPVCGRDHYCLVAKEGGDDPVAAICTKVESPFPRLAAGGWLHRLREGRIGPPARRPIEIPSEPKDVRSDAERFARGADLEAIAEPLGLDAGALRRLGIGFDRKSGASTWPELDASRRVVGISRRFPSGKKRLRSGDRAGLFMPGDLPLDLAGERLLVLEGGSDTAAALGLGRWAVGRHSRSSGLVELVRLARKLRPSTVSFVADRDEDGGGLAWAKKLAERLATCCADVRVIETPAGVKDFRDWARAGLERIGLEREEEAAR
jgi:hypothetical protein